MSRLTGPVRQQTFRAFLWSVPDRTHFMRILLTGVAGFIGFHLGKALISQGHDVLAIDSLNDYYRPQLKLDRLSELGTPANLTFRQVDISDADALAAAVGDFQPDSIIHLAAQAGVRYSLINPAAYADANVRGQINLLELARKYEGLGRFIYASSSSVYGDRGDGPFREDDRCDEPVSVYAATKRAGELISQSYSHLYGMNLTGLRFFTVYGSWGRPDMAYWIFSEAIESGKPVRLFNQGEMRRDFTHVDDVVTAILKVLDAPEKPGHEIYNVGHAEPVYLKEFLRVLEEALGKKAEVELLPMQLGDVGDTFADTTKFANAFGFKPGIGIETGLAEFVAWWRGYAGRNAS